MAFTYVDPGSNDRDKVRFMIGDVDSNDYHFNDAEIAYLLTTWTTPIDAAIAGADMIAGRFAHKTNYSRSIGDLSISESYGTSAAEFRALAASLRKQREKLSPPTIKVNADALKSTRDKTTTTYNTDFYTGIQDNRV